MRKILNALGLLLGVGVGVGVLVLLIVTRPKPKRKPPPDMRPLVEVMTALPGTFEAEVSGFGTVRPSATLAIIVEVGGEVLETGKGVKEGALLEKGALLFRVDDSSLQAEIARLAAQVAVADARLGEMQLQNKADKRLLVIEESILKLARKETSRLQELNKPGYVPKSDLEAAQTRVNERLLVVEKRRAALSSFARRQALVTAEKRAAQASLKRQNLLLAKTTVRVPYRCRVMNLSLQLHQVVQPGVTVMTAFPLGATTEVSVPVESRHLPALFDLKRFKRGTPPWTQVRLKAEVSWTHFGRSYKLSGHLARFGAQVDPNTRTLTAIVELPPPDQRARQDGPRGLLPGTFVRVRLFGRKFTNVMVIPEKAFETRNRLRVVRDGEIHHVNVTPLVTVEGNVLLPVTGGLPPGSKVIMTELPGTPEGTPVRVAGEETLRK
jgi:multidrug efflux pump subunit AcrA (membrane-fusion protein)